MVAVAVVVAVAVGVVVAVVTDLITIENPPPGLLRPGVLVLDPKEGVTGLWVDVDGHHCVMPLDNAFIHYAESIALVLSHPGPDHDACLSRYRVRDWAHWLSGGLYKGGDDV